MGGQPYFLVEKVFLRNTLGYRHLSKESLETGIWTLESESSSSTVIIVLPEVSPDPGSKVIKSYRVIFLTGTPLKILSTSR